MMEGTPDYINLEDLKKLIAKADPDICDIHDLHVWKLGGDQTSLSVHLRSHNPTKSLRLVTEALREPPYSLNHTTIQAEGVDDWSKNEENFACDTDMHGKDVMDIHKHK